MRRGVLGNVGEELRKVALCDRNQVYIKVTIANASWLNKRRTILKKLPGVLQPGVELKGHALRDLGFLFPERHETNLCICQLHIHTYRIIFLYRYILLLVYILLVLLSYQSSVNLVLQLYSIVS